MSPLSTNFDVCAPPSSSTTNPDASPGGSRRSSSRAAGIYTKRSWLGGLSGLQGITLAALLGLMLAGAALAESYHSNPWLLSWIPAACCVTNDCCWEIQESELTPLPGDRYEVRSTGQVRRRTDWSPDGKFYRCACDYTGATWIKHQGANTRCLFVPMRSASR